MCHDLFHITFIYTRFMFCIGAGNLTQPAVVFFFIYLRFRQRKHIKTALNPGLMFVGYCYKSAHLPNVCKPLGGIGTAHICRLPGFTGPWSLHHS